MNQSGEAGGVSTAAGEFVQSFGEHSAQLVSWDSVERKIDSLVAGQREVERVAERSKREQLRVAGPATLKPEDAIGRDSRFSRELRAAQAQPLSRRPHDEPPPVRPVVRVRRSHERTLATVRTHLDAAMSMTASRCIA